MDQIARKILEIEELAKKMEGQSKQLKKQADQAIEENLNQMKQAYIDRTRRRIEIIRETEEQSAAEEIARVTRFNEENKARFDALYAKHKDEWITRIYTSVIGR